ncbi:hypothetical protein CYMTET_50620 [Cymbomonas tetramitiformis]|uniref:Uncharacterized protein n=1 Tax=Cymbomonas tetramitiformis TaxID=36881 RepID=A0AAE0BP26_9CHLO|nr:hypothetical protein CYMTET_50620 [Cymbomonas tetramitiformis]
MTFKDLFASWQEEWGSIDLSAHGVSLSDPTKFKTAIEAIGAEVPLVTKLAHRWAMVFRDDPNVIALVRLVLVGVEWAFREEDVTIVGENYVKEGFPHKVDKLKDEEVRHRRVVPIPDHIAAVHGVGVVDKDHSNFEKMDAGAQEALRQMQDVLEFLGLEVAWEKCEGPVQDIVFLVDEYHEMTQEQRLAIPNLVADSMEAVSRGRLLLVPTWMV